VDPCRRSRPSCRIRPNHSSRYPPNFGSTNRFTVLKANRRWHPKQRQGMAEQCGHAARGANRNRRESDFRRHFPLPPDTAAGGVRPGAWSRPCAHRHGESPGRRGRAQVRARVISTPGIAIGVAAVVVPAVRPGRGPFDGAVRLGLRSDRASLSIHRDLSPAVAASSILRNRILMRPARRRVSGKTGQALEHVLEQALGPRTRRAAAADPRGGRSTADPSPIRRRSAAAHPPREIFRLAPANFRSGGPRP